MQILKHELRANRKALIIWCVCVFFMSVAGMYKFEALGSTGISDMMSQFPKIIAVMFGAVPGLDLGTAEGFYGMLYTYLLIMAGIYAILLAAGILAKEERDKTTEFLVVRPVTRAQIVTQKLLCVLINTVIYDIVGWLSGIAALRSFTVSGSMVAHVTLMTLGIFFFQLVFIGIGMVFAASFKDSKRSSMFAILILLVTYLFYVAYCISPNIVLRLLSPFAYFLPGSMINGWGMGWPFAIICIAVCAVLISVSYKNYRTRDLAI